MSFAANQYRYQFSYRYYFVVAALAAGGSAQVQV
jgi:hypothetical protein